MSLALPAGRNGRMLALGLLLVTLAIIWAGLIWPAARFYEQRSVRLSQRQLLLTHMIALADALPRLRQSAANAAAHAERSSFLAGKTDAVAAANLENLVQDLASKAGIAVSRTESLPPTMLGRYRKIGVRFDLKASEPALTTFLVAIEQAPSPLIIDDTRLRGAPLPITDTPDIVDCSLSVYALRQPAEETLP